MASDSTIALLKEAILKLKADGVQHLSVEALLNDVTKLERVGRKAEGGLGDQRRGVQVRHPGRPERPTVGNPSEWRRGCGAIGVHRQAQRRSGDPCP